MPISELRLGGKVRAAEAEADDGRVYTLDEVSEETGAAARLPL